VVLGFDISVICTLIFLRFGDNVSITSALIMLAG